ncbi:MAG: CBS domain-containing protein [Candidatus Micrarchaeia archaeon]|jgi:predicted transcriptional regulator
MRAIENVPSEFVSETVTFDYKDPVTEAISKVKDYTAVIVNKNDEYYGIVDDRTLIRKGAIKLNKKQSIGKFAKKVPTLDRSTTIERAIMYFYYEGVKALPYSDEDKIKGIVKRTEILKAILSLHLLSKYKVENAMTSPVIGIDADANIAQAKAVMAKNKINRLVVIKNGSLYGLITFREIVETFAKATERSPQRRNYYYTLSNTPVSSVCQRSVLAIEQESPLEDAIRLMVERGISSLVVTKNDKPVGIVTVRDVFGLIVSLSTEEENKIIISGLDDYTKEYEEDIRAELNDMVNKINRFSKVKVDYVALNVKRSKVRNYEMHAKVVLKKGGSVAASATGYSMSSVLKEIINRLYNEVKEKKELIIAQFKGNSIVVL